MTTTKHRYKQTDVGVIPDDWEVSVVGYEYEITLGKMLDAEKNTTGVPKVYIGNKAVQWNQIDINDLPTVLLTAPEIGKFRLKKGDLIVCEGGEVGRCAIWEAPIEECYYQKALHRLRPLREFNSQFMAAYLRYLSDGGKFSSYVTQTSIAHFSREQFLKLPIPLPPLPEQTAIASVLSDIDSLVDALERLIAKKRDLKRAAMHQLLTAKTRLPGFSGKWEVKTLGEVGSTYSGLTGKTKSDFGVGLARYITFLNVMSNVVIDCSTFEPVNVASNESQNRAMKGDLFFNGSSETPEEVAMCAMLCEEVQDVYLNSFCFGFRLRDDANINGLFLAYYFRSQEGRNLIKLLAQGSTRYNLSKVALLKSQIRIPPLPEQTAIAAVLSDMDAELAALELRLTKTRDIKRAAMQELLTGRTRLV